MPFLVLVLAATIAADPVPVVLDGSFDDWADVPVATVDPKDAEGAEVDFGEVRIRHDASYVDLLFETGGEVNLQQMDGSIFLLFDADGSERTGGTRDGMAGIDLAIQCSAPHSRGAPMGLALHVPATDGRPERTLSPYEADVQYAPTHAATRFELRIARGGTVGGSPRLFAGRELRVRLVALDAAGAVVDTTDVVTHRLDRDVAPVARSEVDPFARPEGAGLRVLSWNVEFGAILEKPEPFVRVLRAAEPDVILLQELKSAQSAASLAALLDRELPAPNGGSWQVTWGAGGGNLRCAVATRGTSASAAAFDSVEMPGRNGRTVRAAGAVVSMGDRRILAVSVHLKCCGRTGGSEDRTRMEETGAVVLAIRAALAEGGIDGVVVAGDLNLVGGPAPLGNLRTGIDVDGSDLAVALPLQPDGLTSATWQDAHQPFVPGRLDYLLFSDSALAVRGGSVLDTRDLAPAVLRRHGLLAGDGLASDHMPILIDLAAR